MRQAAGGEGGVELVDDGEADRALGLATFQSSGTGGTSWAESSFLTSRLPTWGPLPWVTTTSAPVATTPATCPAATAMAARWAAGVAEPSGPVIALPPRAITTRRCEVMARP